MNLVVDAGERVIGAGITFSDINIGNLAGILIAVAVLIQKNCFVLTLSHTQ